MLARNIPAPRAALAFAIPYYTRKDADTEYLVSNPNAAPVSGQLHVFGPKCTVVKVVKFRLGQYCTRSIRLRAIVPDHAGFSILIVTAPVILHLLYYTGSETVLAGGELAAKDNLFAWHPMEKSRTYGFGYRAAALVTSAIGGAMFVSNPNTVALTGTIDFYDQKCRRASRKKVRIDPGCTGEFAFPRDRFGYGLICVSAQACINVLHHFPGRRLRVTAAELIGESNRVVPTAPTPAARSKVLLDDTHGCRPGNPYTQYEYALTTAGYSVAHCTSASVTLAELAKYDVFVIAMAINQYSSAERQALSDFVNQGGGLLLITDFGGGVWSEPMRELLNTFGASDENNAVSDEIHQTPEGHVLFEAQRNFLAHPITNTIASFHTAATATLSGDTEWATVVETDDDSEPVRRPVLMVRSFGAGRIVAYGDTNSWSDMYFGNLDNGRLAVRSTEWALFRL